MAKGKSMDLLTLKFMARNAAMVAGFKVGDRVFIDDDRLGTITNINTDLEFLFEVTWPGQDCDISDDFAASRLSIAK